MKNKKNLVVRRSVEIFLPVQKIAGSRSFFRLACALYIVMIITGGGARGVHVDFFDVCV